MARLFAEVIGGGNEDVLYTSGEGTEQFNGAYFDNQAGVQFTIYQLNKELQSLGHEFKRSSLVDALRICSGVLLTISKDDGALVMESPIFPLLLLGRKQDWVQHPKDTRCYVKFHPLVTQSIGSLTYRQFDYASYMHYTHRLSRWLHKRLAHNYSQAGLLHPYTIRLSTILRDSGTHHSLRASNNARQVEEALTELQERDIVMSLTRDVLRGPRHSLVGNTAKVTLCLWSEAPATSDAVDRIALGFVSGIGSASGNAGDA